MELLKYAKFRLPVCHNSCGSRGFLQAPAQKLNEYLSYAFTTVLMPRHRGYGDFATEKSGVKVSCGECCTRCLWWLFVTPQFRGIREHHNLITVINSTAFLAGSERTQQLLSNICTSKSKSGIPPKINTNT